MKKNDELAREGWEKKITYDEPRLSEIVEAYEEMGFEVRLEPFDPDDEPGCIECMKAAADRFKTVYIRKKTV